MFATSDREEFLNQLSRDCDGCLGCVHSVHGRGHSGVRSLLGFADSLDASAIERSEVAKDVPLIRLGQEFAEIVGPAAQPDPGDVAEPDSSFIVYTSETTSAPKGAVLTHMNLISQTINSNRFGPPKSSGDCNLIVVPLFHISTLASIDPAFLNGTKIVVAPAKALARM